MTDYLQIAYPGLAKSLRRAPLADLPTPITRHTVSQGNTERVVLVKHDSKTSELYGGNKVRKLEYLLQRAVDRGAERVATFGAVGSNHALATALHAKGLGLESTCFLAHQSKTPNIARTLDRHLVNGTELVRYGGRVDHLALFRQFLQKRKTWVIPLGGTCRLNTVGFVNAGLELAAQIEDGSTPMPDRIYMANGTMGSVAGLALGIAASGLPIRIQAVRVADNRFVNQSVLHALIAKTATLLNRYDARFSPSLAQQVRIDWRGDFFAGGYAKSDATTTDAMTFAAEALDLTLESTYTGKAMAALLHDIERGVAGEFMFWNTYSAPPEQVQQSHLISHTNLPEEFERYYE